MSFKTEHGYSPVLPFVFIGLVLGSIGFIVAAFNTADWRWLVGAVACYAAVASK